METEKQPSFVDCASGPTPPAPSPETADPQVSLQCSAPDPQPVVPTSSSELTESPQAPVFDDDDDDELTGADESGEYEDGEDTDSEPPVDDMLTDRQRQAIETVYQRAAFQTSILLVSGQFDYPKRFQSLGIDCEDMMRTLEYIAQDAPIIIHFKVEDHMLSSLLNDTHYKNLFETGASNGNPHKKARRIWEDSVFGGCYSDAEDHERPKYGVLNPTNDPRGFKNIWDQYGYSYMRLKNSPELRARCTVADRDTSDPHVTLTVFEWEQMTLLCWFFTDDELSDVTEVATGKKPHGDSTLAMHYKEVQIHGPVCLDEDVEELVLHPQYKAKRYIHTLDRIKEKHGIKYSWMKLENEHKKKVGKRKTPKK